MELKHFVDYRSIHNILVRSMNAKELKENVRKDGTIQAKVLYKLEHMISDSKDTVIGDVSTAITGNPEGLSNVSFDLAGRTTRNEVILKVTGTPIFED